MYDESPASYLTKCGSLNHPDVDVDVGDLRAASNITPPGISSTTKVFSSQTLSDNTKSEIARPTWWFVSKKLGLDAFIDERDIECGDDIPEELLRNAYECTHAICFLSPNYRTRKTCVRELNTFMKRKNVEKDGLEVIPVLWKIEDTKGYCRDLGKIKYIRFDSAAGLVQFLTNVLWPQLEKRLNGTHRSRQAYKDILVEYVETHRGKHETPIPDALERFAKRQRAKGLIRRVVVVTLALIVLLVGTVVALVVVFGGKSTGGASVESPAITPTEFPVFDPPDSPIEVKNIDGSSTGCQGDQECDTSFCLDTVCCTECRRIVLTAVKTAGDGAGGWVEPRFSINEIQVYPIGIPGGVGSLKDNSLHFFDPNPQLGNIPPNSEIKIEVFEEDDSSMIDWHIVDVDNDDIVNINILPEEWYRADDRDPYELFTVEKSNWQFFYRVETECCAP